MVGNSKVIYLQREDGMNIKAYVVDYLFDRVSGKNYVIVANQNGKNAKGYEIVDEQAVILGAEAIGIFKGYKVNPSFEITTSKYEDGLSYKLVKVASKKEEIEISESEENHHEEISESEENHHEESSNPVAEVVEQEEIVDNIEQPALEEQEPVEKKDELEMPEETIKEEKPIIFYMYDQNVVKKYQALMIEEQEHNIKVKNIKAVEVISGASGLDVNQFLRGEAVEVGAYFVNYDNYNPTIETQNGKLIATATLTETICKTADMVETKKITEEVESANIESEVKTEENRILLFNGDIDVYQEKKHYTIWGCFCTVVSETPFTVIPDKNGVKTIIYEDESANSIMEVCQTYQNLYPNFRVYLTETEIKGSEPIILEEYQDFKPQPNTNQKTLLESGRKVLTEAEMIEKRKQELEVLKKKIHK